MGSQGGHGPTGPAPQRGGRTSQPDRTLRVVVVGAGLGGLRVAEQLRTTGFTGEIVVYGDEPHLPYSRPPLSKEGLAGGLDHQSVAFRRKAAADSVSWRLGGAANTVTAADLPGHVLTMADGSGCSYDALVAATGVSARRLALDAPLAWRHVVRTLDDAVALRALLVPGTAVVVMGAGFIGCEVAATARLLGCEVDLVDPMPVPLLRPLGSELGAQIRSRHERHGVRFHLGRTVARIDGDTGPRWVVLDDGTQLAAGVVVEAVGSVPNVAWLTGNDLDLTDGVRCDVGLRVVAGERVLRDTVAVGDICRFPNLLFDQVPRRVEHWNFPTETAKRAAAVLALELGAPGGTDPVHTLGPFTPMPAFWSDQYDVRLQSFGLPGLGGADIRLLEGDLAGECAVGYHRDGILVGVVFLGLTGRYTHYRNLIAAGQPSGG